MRSPITTHVLDTARGKPAAGIDVTLEHWTDRWSVVARGVTDEDGRVADLLPAAPPAAGRYRIRFDVGAYHAAQGLRGFYPYVEIVFEITAPNEHHHVPLLLNPFGYSTYRGS